MPLWKSTCAALQSARGVWRQRCYTPYVSISKNVAICTGRVEAKGEYVYAQSTRDLLQSARGVWRQRGIASCASV